MRNLLIQGEIVGKEYLHTQVKFTAIEDKSHQGTAYENENRTEYKCKDDEYNPF